MSVSGSRLKQVHEALVSSFSKAELRELARFYLDLNLEEIAGDDNLRDIAMELVDWANKNGRIQDLINAACRLKSGSPVLQQLKIDSQTWDTRSTRSIAAGQAEPQPHTDANKSTQNTAHVLQVLSGVGLLAIVIIAAVVFISPGLLRLTPSSPPPHISTPRPTEAAAAEISHATQSPERDKSRATEPYTPPAAAMTAKPSTLLDCSLVTSIPNAQCESLAEVYQYAMFPERSVADDSFAANDPCTWHGEVACGDGNVTALTLPKRKLSGSISPSIGALKYLEVLRLNDNGLTGPIPREIGQLVNLRELWLYNNRLSGSIPPELGQLVNLEHLHLGNNVLTGAIPAEIGRLSKLIELQIYSNTLTGTIPQDLGNLPNLTALNLDDNQLTGTIPPELGELTNINSNFGLANNHLEGPIPEELGALADMRFLDLRCNNLEGEIPVSLCQLKALNQLSLQGNRLTGIVPKCLAYLPLLSDIQLGGNSLTATEPKLEDSLREQGSECVSH
jgi:hypothetical protein